jgi:hypothetical protein
MAKSYRLKLPVFAALLLGFGLITIALNAKDAPGKTGEQLMSATKTVRNRNNARPDLDAAAAGVKHETATFALG